MSGGMAAAALASLDATARSDDDSRLRTGALFASLFGVLIFLEACTGFWNSAPADMRLHYLWRSFYWAAADVALWWICVSVADAMSGDRSTGYPYVLAAVAASAAAPFVHWATQTWYFDSIPGRNPMPSFLAWWMISIVGACRLTLLTAAYFYRLRSLADAAHLARARLDRAMRSRKAIESQLRALQGKVDPSLLFETLDDIEQASEWDGERADRMLECLIAFLRCALPHTGEEDTTVANELALAGAFLALAQARNDQVDYAIDADALVREAAIAPMLVTPLVGHAVRAMRDAHCSVRIACTLEEPGLRIVIAAQGADAGAVWLSTKPAEEVAKRLEDVYGTAASLAVGASGTDRMQFVLQLPNEHGSRSHR